ncbi:MAG: beta-ketoacyl-ACP synthase II [Candidatus Magnetomorum sp.]|nr:beta-ketoacyl-ACP synthase II [Candidatus Magnetomorum sp.]
MTRLPLKSVHRRVVITGIGIISPLAIGTNETWTALCQGKSGIQTITRFDASALDTQIAAEVNNFDRRDFFSNKESRNVENFVAYAVAASRMATEDAKLHISEHNAHRIGVFSGCGFGGLHRIEQTHIKLLEQSANRTNPFFIPSVISNMSAGRIAIHLKAKGPNATISTACASGAHAIGEAFHVIKRSDADVMIAGGVESVISPLCIAGFSGMRALSKRNHEPEKASRPFDLDRDGFVVGEGAGILILEELTHALDRHAKIYAEIVGFAMNCDAYHISAPDTDGSASCMKQALESANISPETIQYINAHGTSTCLNDASETNAIRAVFGDHAGSLAVSSTKSMTGHLLGGAGGLESAVCALSIFHETIPPTINLDTPDPECDLDYVPNIARSQKKIVYAMNNSFGFGGANACLIFKNMDH